MDKKGNRKKFWILWKKIAQSSVIILFSVYGPFSDRVGLPLHNIPSPFHPIMDVLIDYRWSY